MCSFHLITFAGERVCLDQQHLASIKSETTSFHFIKAVHLNNRFKKNWKLLQVNLFSSFHLHFRWRSEGHTRLFLFKMKTTYYQLTKGKDRVYFFPHRCLILTHSPAATSSLCKLSSRADRTDTHTHTHICIFLHHIIIDHVLPNLFVKCSSGTSDDSFVASRWITAPL